MNPKLKSLFNLYCNLRSAQEIVNEILIMDGLVNNYDEQKSKEMIDFFVHKYNKEIKLISSLKKDMVVIDHDEHLYDDKTEEDINSDCEYIRNALIVIGAVLTGIRRNLREALDEIGGI